MENKTEYIKDHPVDVVIAWVDGSDPVLAEKRSRYTNRWTIIDQQNRIHQAVITARTANVRSISQSRDARKGIKCSSITSTCD